jgi:predicted component of type VI protein secretion system
MVAADLSNGLLTAALSVYEKGNVNNNNFNAILSEYSLKENLTVKNSLADDGSENNIGLTFCTSRWKTWASTHYRVAGCRNPGHKVRGN